MTLNRRDWLLGSGAAFMASALRGQESPQTPPAEVASPGFLRSVCWKRLDAPGMEYFSLRHYNQWELSGVVVTSFDSRPAQVSYQVSCDDDFKARLVEVRVLSGPSEQILRLAVDNQGRWFSTSGEIPELRGILDADVSLTPSTNMLPIRRLKPPVGREVEISAAWVRLPALKVEPVKQSYTRVSEAVYRYKNLQSGFTADLEVDEDGLPVRYGSFFERVASVTGTRTKLELPF